VRTAIELTKSHTPVRQRKMNVFSERKRHSLMTRFDMSAGLPDEFD